MEKRTSHASFGFVHNFPLRLKDMKVLVVMDDRFMSKGKDNMKLPGGVGEVVVGNCRNMETPEETLRREVTSETGVQILDQKLVYTKKLCTVEHDKELCTDYENEHFQYFFLATKVSALPKINSFPRRVEEENVNINKAKRLDNTEKLTRYWLSLPELHGKLFEKQRKAFKAILREFAHDAEFFEAYSYMFIAD